MIRLDVIERDKRDGYFEARIGDRLVCISRQPFLDAARILVAEGVDPTTRMQMFNRGTPSLAGPIGVAAKLDAGGGRFQILPTNKGGANKPATPPAALRCPAGQNNSRTGSLARFQPPPQPFCGPGAGSSRPI